MATPGANFRNLMVMARNSDFQDRVHYCMTKAAVAIMAEVDTTPNHALRVAYSKSILAGGANIFEYAVGVLTNGTIKIETNIEDTTDAKFGIPDDDIEFTVNTMVDAFAGASK